MRKPTHDLWHAEGPLVATLYQPVKAQPLHAHVVQQMVRLIVSGTLSAGAALPSESELADYFRVSRTVIREAVRLLASKGLVDVKHGRGMWVLPSSRWDKLSPLVLFERLQVRGDNQVLFNELLEVRRLVEVEAAGLAAARRTSADLPALQAAVAGMQARPDDADTHTRLDVEFHDRILAAARNEMLRELVRPVAEVLGAARTLTNRNGRLDESLRGHEAILAAVEAGDGPAAREAMRTHIARFERDVAQYALLSEYDDAGVKQITAGQQMTEGEVA